jgi:hypothetical protein
MMRTNRRVVQKVPKVSLLGINESLVESPNSINERKAEKSTSGTAKNWLDARTKSVGDAAGQAQI